MQAFGVEHARWQCLEDNSRLDFQLLRKTRQNPAACFCDQNDVFHAHSTESGIIKPRLNREHLPIFQNNLLQTWMLVDFQPESVSGSVEKSDPAPVAHLSWKTTTAEEFLDGFVNRHSVNAGFDSL